MKLSLLHKTKEGNELEKPRINWKPKIPWSKANEEQAEAIDAMFYADDESLAITKELNGHILHYKYAWIDYNQSSLKTQQV